MTQPSLPLESPCIARLMAKRAKAHASGQFLSEARLDRAIHRQRHADLKAWVDSRPHPKARRVNGRAPR